MKILETFLPFLILVSLESDLGAKLGAQIIIQDVNENTVVLPIANYDLKAWGFLSPYVQQRCVENFFLYQSNEAELWSNYSSIDR